MSEISRRRARLPRVAALLARLVLLAGIVAWLGSLRPAGLGGTTSYVFVGGDSMLPTYRLGDLVVAKPEASYDPGDIVVYRIPADEPGAGHLVVHRIAGGSDEIGFTTQGDHNDYVDIWHPRASDILGVPVAVVPRAGVVVMLLRRPAIAATLAALVTIVLLWPRATRAGPTQAGSLRVGPARG